MTGILIFIALILSISVMWRKQEDRRLIDQKATYEDLCIAVKCVMKDGVYFASTDSSEPLYEGEKPTHSIYDNKSFKVLLNWCASYKQWDWRRDLIEKQKNMNNIEDLEIAVECMLKDGVYYSSTNSSELSYIGEEPECSFDNAESFNALVEMCIRENRFDLANALKKARHEYYNQ